MKIKVLDTPLSVLQVEKIDSLDLSISPLFIANTEDEISLVMPTDKVPKETIHCENGWRALKIVGVLDFSLVGILANISSLLANHAISIFAVSTYNTDYILIKEDKLREAINVLKQDGYEME